MLAVWQNFIVLILVQILLFIACAIYEKKLSGLLQILLGGMFTGIVIGLLSDLLWGKFFDLWSYSLGYSAFALILTAAFVYGLFAANVLLLQQARLSRFFVWVMIIMAAYEIANHFFRVWTYELSLPLFGFLLFLIVGYLATAVFVAVVWNFFLGYKFLFIDTLVKR